MWVWWTREGISQQPEQSKCISRINAIRRRKRHVSAMSSFVVVCWNVLGTCRGVRVGGEVVGSQPLRISPLPDRGLYSSSSQNASTASKLRAHIIRFTLGSKDEVLRHL